MFDSIYDGGKDYHPENLSLIFYNDETLGTVMPYLKEIQKIYKLAGTTYEPLTSLFLHWKLATFAILRNNKYRLNFNT